MRDIVIRPSDYDELTETLSEKNIINTVEGNEFIVTSLSETELHSKFIDPNTISQVFSSAPYTENTAIFNPSMQVYFNSGEAGLFGAPIDKDWARSETIYYSDEYKFQTSKVITDTNSLACKFSINYIKSDADSIGEDNFNKQNRTVFFRAGSYFPQIKNEGEDALVTNEFLDAKPGTAKAQFLWGVSDIIAPMPSLPEYCKVTDVVKNETGYEVTVAYRFKIWAGWTTDNQTENTVLCVNNITITTVANTVDIKETPFLWQEGIIDVERKYELETNELFQTSGTESKHDKLSYQTYQEIAKAFKDDRRIISFILLNLPKIVVNEGLVFENGKVQERYIDNEDEFSIYDEHNEYMGDFKVVQCNPIWDGSYHKRISAILIGEHPISTIFAENDWGTIASVFRSGKASQYWKVGDTKPVEIAGNTYNVRIADMQIGRYNYSNSNNKSNGVFEFVEVMPIASIMNETETNQGGYPVSYLNKTTMPQILDILPSELRESIPSVEIPCYDGGNTNSSLLNIVKTPSRIFIPSLIEIGKTYYLDGDYFVSYKDGKVLDYYINNPEQLRGKPNVSYWVRTPTLNTSVTFPRVFSDGSIMAGETPTRTMSISLFFAI